MSRALPEPVPHGGDLDSARARWPHAPEPWIDLSTGINPIPYPLPDVPPMGWSRLPLASEELALRAAAAHRYGAGDPGMIVSAPGTQALIQILPRLVDRSDVAVLAPTYAEHAVAWCREGHDVREVPDLSSIGGARVVVLVNPNNPTGRLIPRPLLHALARELDSRGGLLVVDEAFADVLPAEASLVADIPNATIVLRSFGKMYGLAGLRLGFAISQPLMAVRLRDYLGPWAVSGPALHIGTVALADDQWLEAAVRRLQEDQRRLDALLLACGCALIGGTLLFRLFEHRAAAELAATLGQHGIHVRQFHGHPTWLRFGLPADEHAWRRLEGALRTIGTT